MATHQTIGQKLLLAIGLPALLVAGTGVFALWKQTDKLVKESTMDQATTVADLVSNTFQLTEGSSVNAHRPVRVLLDADWKSFQNVERIRITDPQGRIRWSRLAEEVGTSVPVSERPAPDIESVQSDGRSVTLTRPLGGLVCANCHAQAAMKVGLLEVQTRTPRLQQEVTGVFQLGFFGFLLFSIVLFVATALSLQFFLRRPLMKLSAVMRRAEAGDFLVRAETKNKDEMGQLAIAFNQMLARITSLKAQEIDTHRDLVEAQQELSLKKELQNRHNELRLLFEVASALTSTLDLTELLRRITQQVAERLKIHQFSVMLLNAEGLLEVKGAFPADQGTEGLTFKVGEGACGKAAQTRHSVYLPDLAKDSDIYQQRTAKDVKNGSLLSVPMIHTNTLLGVLNFQHPEPAGFGPENMDLLSAVADQAAIAVKNAMLHDQTVMLSMTDALTGIANRRHLFTQLELEIARANRYDSQLSVLMIDLDHFKLLNDHSGHQSGDRVLRRVAELMHTIVRKVDTLARYGGEEYMLLLPQVAKAEAVEVAEKIRAAIQAHVFDEGPRQPFGFITLSIGVATYPLDASNLDSLVDSVDSALYASKRGGRNKVTAYAPGMELHPGRERGPHAAKRAKTGEQPLVLPTQTQHE